MAVLSVVYASHHPHQRRSRGTSTDVQRRLQENSGTTPPAPHPRHKIDVVARYGGEKFAPKGPVPPNQPNAYNAVEVMRNLEPKLDR